MRTNGLRILALDGGGAFSKDQLVLLRDLMNTIDPTSPPSPSECFDMIGGTGTGGIIAIMLGRLEMTVEQCIKAVEMLSDACEPPTAPHANNETDLEMKDKADRKLEELVKEIFRLSNSSEDQMLLDEEAPCRVLVSTTDKKVPIRLASYRFTGLSKHDSLTSPTTYQELRAMLSAAASSPLLSLKPCGERNVDSILGMNNPIELLWHEAKGVWGEQVESKIQCLLSIGTDAPIVESSDDDAEGELVSIIETLKLKAVQTERQFLVKNPGLVNDKLYHRFDAGVESEAMHRQIAACAERLCKYLEPRQSPSAALFKKMYNLVFARPEPPIPAGMARVRWTCSCGDKLFADFSTREPEALRDFQLRLEEMCASNNNDGESQHHRQYAFRGVLRLAPDLCLWAYRHVAARLPKLGKSKVGGLPQHGCGTPVNGPVAESPLHILMCIDKSDNWTKLYQVPIPSHIGNDVEFFKLLRKEFRSRLSAWSWLSPRGIKSLSLTRFDVDNNSYASVHGHNNSCRLEKCVCIPPLERVMAGEYVCSPAPVETPTGYPPIKREMLTHYFKKPHDLMELQRSMFEQTPKRTGALASSPSRFTLGWGLHIEQGWDWRAVYLIMIVLFSIALILMVLWTKAFGDMSSSIRFAGSVATLGTGILGYISARNL